MRLKDGDIITMGSSDLLVRISDLSGEVNMIE
jgi:hypothetical protein